MHYGCKPLHCKIKKKINSSIHFNNHSTTDQMNKSKSTVYMNEYIYVGTCINETKYNVS